MHTSHYSRLEKPTIPLATQEDYHGHITCINSTYRSLPIRTTDASQLKKRNKEKKEDNGKERKDKEAKKRKRKRKEKKIQEKQEKTKQEKQEIEREKYMLYSQ